jgi:hypothetical protein
MPCNHFQVENAGSSAQVEEVFSLTAITSTTGLLSLEMGEPMFNDDPLA